MKIKSFIWKGTFYFLLFFLLFWFVNLLWYRPFNIGLFYEREFILDKLSYPQELNKWRILELYGFSSPNRHLNSFHNSMQTEDLERKIHAFHMLNTYRRVTQTPEELVSTHVLHFLLENTIIFHSYPFKKDILTDSEAISLSFSLFMLWVHQIEDTEDAFNYIHRLSAFPKKIEEEIENLKNYMEMGNTLPKIILDNAKKQLNYLIEEGIEGNIFYKDFNHKIINSKLVLKDMAREELFYFLKLEIENNIIPYWKKMYAYLDSLEYRNLEDKNTEIDPMYYKNLLDFNITKNLEDENILSIIMSYYVVFTEKINSAKIEIDTLKNHPMRLSIKDTSKVNFSDIKLFLKELSQRAKKIFDNELDTTQFDILDMYPFQSSYYSYYEGSLDGERKPKLFFNLQETTNLPVINFYVWSMEKIFPGYFFLRQTQNMNKDLPLFRRVVQFDFFQRGWELHSLHTLVESGIIWEPELKQAIYKHCFLRVCMAIVDINIHKGAWSIEEAIEFLSRSAEVDRAYATHEVQEVLRFPTRYISAVIGFDFINKYKSTSQNTLTDFQEKEFYRSLLFESQVPIKVLNEKVKFLSDF